MKNYELIEKIEVISSNMVACSGEQDPSGHPKVFMNLIKGKAVSCPYCSKKFFSN